MKKHILFVLSTIFIVSCTFTATPPATPAPTRDPSLLWFGEQSLWKPDSEILGGELSEILYSEPFQSTIEIGSVTVEDWKYGLQCLYVDFNGHNCEWVIAPDLNPEMFNEEYLLNIDKVSVSIFGTIYSTRNYDEIEGGQLFVIERITLR